MEREHTYEVTVDWVGNQGVGTASYTAYSRDHAIRADEKSVIPGSSDAAFRGDPARYNPEELLVAALSACHMLEYLHLCAVNGIQVVAYSDRAHGVMVTRPDGSGSFSAVTLHPKVTIARGSAERARTLHEEAHQRCYIAGSVNFPVSVEGGVVEASAPTPA
jgi:organic hydroperoxide reductase OsmC/OhrA